FSSRRRHTRFSRDWSSDVCSSDLPVYQYDNAATVAFALGIKTPMAWIGRPVKNAFEGFELGDDYPIAERLEQPIILPAPDLNKRSEERRVGKEDSCGWQRNHQDGG